MKKILAILMLAMLFVSPAFPGDTITVRVVSDNKDVTKLTLGEAGTYMFMMSNLSGQQVCGMSVSRDTTINVGGLDKGYYVAYSYNCNGLFSRNYFTVGEPEEPMPKGLRGR